MGYYELSYFIVCLKTQNIKHEILLCIFRHFLLVFDGDNE